MVVGTAMSDTSPIVGQTCDSRDGNVRHKSDCRT